MSPSHFQPFEGSLSKVIGAGLHLGEGSPALNIMRSPKNHSRLNISACQRINHIAGVRGILLIEQFFYAQAGDSSVDSEEDRPPCHHN